VSKSGVSNYRVSTCTVRSDAAPAWFRGGLVFKAHRLVYHSTLGSRVLKRRRRLDARPRVLPVVPPRLLDNRCLGFNVKRFRGGLVIKAHRLLYLISEGKAPIPSGESYSSWILVRMRSRGHDLRLVGLVDFCRRDAFAVVREPRVQVMEPRVRLPAPHARQ